MRPGWRLLYSVMGIGLLLLGAAGCSDSGANSTPPISLVEELNEKPLRLEYASSSGLNLEARNPKLLERAVSEMLLVINGMEETIQNEKLDGVTGRASLLAERCNQLLEAGLPVSRQEMAAFSNDQECYETMMRYHDQVEDIRVCAKGVIYSVREAANPPALVFSDLLRLKRVFNEFCEEYSYLWEDVDGTEPSRVRIVPFHAPLSETQKNAEEPLQISAAPSSFSNPKPIIIEIPAP